jgi:hypothetical protein
MLNSILKKAIGMAAIAGGAAVATAGARYAGSKRINAAQRLGEALLDTSRLDEASRYTAAESEAALAACAAYLINMAHQASAGITGPPAIDPIGFERKVKADSGAATATITTTAHEPEARWQFEVEAPGVGRISGSRRLKSSRFAGPKVHMSTPDTVSIRLDNGYVANVESDMEFSGNLLAVPLSGPKTHVFGSASLSDNRGNVGRMRIEANGEVSGTVTRGAEIVGRFEGTLADGLTFRQYIA